MSPSARIPQISATFLLPLDSRLILLDRPLFILRPHRLQPLKHRVIAAGFFYLSMFHSFGWTDAPGGFEPVLWQHLDVLLVLQVRFEFLSLVIIVS